MCDHVCKDIFCSLPYLMAAQTCVRTLIAVMHVQVDAAIVWLKHCQQYDLLQTESATVKACMLAIARQFLQLYISRREDLEALGASMLLRIMQAYARSAAIETHGYNCGNGHDRSNLQIAICEADAKHIDGKVHHWLASCYLPDH